MPAAKKPKAGNDLAEMIALLKEDHAKVDKLFKRYQKLKAADDESRHDLVPEICTALTAHATVEEEIFYPAARDALGGEDDEEMVNEADVEHEHIKTLVGDLEGMSPEDESFDARVKVLGEYVKHHVKEEEGELFPSLKKGKDSFDGLAARMQERHDALAGEGDEEEDDDRRTPRHAAE